MLQAGLLITPAVASTESFNPFASEQPCNVAVSLSSSGIRGILLDIEGTTTPIQFVYETLFPYIRNQLDSFMKARTQDLKIQEVIRALRLEREDDLKAELSPPDWEDPPLAYIRW